MAFVDHRFQTRRRSLADALATSRYDAMLITHLPNVYYMSGFTGSNAAMLISNDGRAAIATDGRYTTQIAAEVPDLAATIERNAAAGVLAHAHSPARVAVEAAHLSLAEFERLKELAPDDITLVPATEFIEPLRVIKDPQELDALREVAEIGNKAWASLLDDGCIQAGVTERHVAAELEYRMRELGSERESFDTIVAAGANSAMPHHGADDTVIKQGDLVTVDFGAYLTGYNSDMTRTVVVGSASGFAEEIYEIVLKSQIAGIAAATAGTPLVDVDKACRDIIDEAGYGEYFVHSTGHGVGLDVHEAPAAATRGTGVLREGMTLTIEPGIYVPGQGGVRIEDTLIITTAGPELITRGNKDLTVV